MLRWLIFFTSSSYIYHFIIQPVRYSISNWLNYEMIFVVYTWGSYIKDVRKILPIFDPPTPCPHWLWAYPLPPGRLASAIHIHKEKISTMLLIFCGTLDICEQPLIITYMPSSAVWVMACIRSLPNFLSWISIWLTRSLTFLREGDLAAKLKGWWL